MLLRIRNALLAILPLDFLDSPFPNQRTLRLAMLFACLGFVSCARHKAAESSSAIDQAWAPFLAMVTDGEISRHGPVRLRFVEAMVDSSEVGKEAKDQLHLDPSATGTVTWETTHDLIFRPTTVLEQGRQYAGTLSPKGLRGVPGDIGDFVFRFSVLKQSYHLEWKGFAAMGGKDTALYSMEGQVVTADRADSTELAAFLSAQQGKQKLAVIWTHGPDGFSHTFRLLDVRRGKERSSVHVTLHPKALGMSVGDEDHDMPVPALGEFDLLSAKALEGSTQGIELLFTDPLSPQSDLGALIRVPGSSPLRFDAQGGRLDVFLPKPVAGTVTVEIDERLADLRGDALGKTIRKEVSFTVEKPGLRFVGQGVILPDADKLLVPIEAASLREITVEALQVYASNMGQFLQVNGWDGDNESRRVGRTLWRKHIKLVDDTARAPLRWTRYSVDVTDLLKENPGSLFRLKLNMSRSQSTYPCSDSSASDTSKEEKGLGNWEGDKARESSGWDGWSEEWDGEGERPSENPCTDEFFERNAPKEESRERNLMASNIGILAKAGSDSSMLVTTTNLRTAEILTDVDIVAFDFQNQAIGKASTNGDGFATLKLEGIPFYLKATKGRDIGFLKVSQGSSLAVSHFDVGGVQANDGVKGLIYGERGVWRPGDSLFLTLVVEDRRNTLPKGHPIRFELHDPQGKLVHREIRPYDPSGFHVFRLATDPASPTGTWTATALLGDRRFEKAIKIETVKPNRLDVKLRWQTDTLWNAKLKGTLQSQWLHGGSAEGLRTEVSAVLRPFPLQFGRFADFVFEDPSRSFQADPQSVFEGTIGPEGKTTVTGSLEVSGKPAGALQAVFTSRVFESGGDASVERTENVFHYYPRYVGIRLPKGDQAREMLRTDTTHIVQIAILDPKGRSTGSAKLKLTLRKMNWKWWYEKNQDSPAEFENSEYNSLLADTILSAPQGTAHWALRMKYPEWGRYFLRVCDEDGGHCAGKVFYMDWPGWAGRAKEQQGVGASMLSVTADKEAYKVGETAVLTIPSSGQGRALVSLETGSRVVKAYWVVAKPGANRVEIPLDAQMTPVVYAHVSLVQPHEGRKNDLPLRLYGIVPLRVEDPASRLSPLLVTPQEVRPNQPLQVRVKEALGRPMTYTVAVVDEGLLGLTRFQTPDPLAEFREKEALGVKTWDLFDWVVGAYGGQLDRLLSLGGDEAGKPGESAKVSRFPPLVRFQGPFRLEKGQESRITFDLPEYVGRVRVMVVAGADGAWGSQESQVFVRKPLMILPTLPRVARPGEEISVPVSIFAMKDGLGKVQVNLDPGSLLALDGLKREIPFPKSGEGMVSFKLKVPAASGPVTLRFKASAGGEFAEQTVQIPIVVAGVPQVTHQDIAIAPGASWSGSVSATGLPGTLKGSLEISAVPRLGLESRLEELIGYPHGCLEQTTSKAFPQLLVPDVMQLSQAQQDEIRSNVKAGLQRLQGFQLPGGGLGYWPGSSEEQWASLWAGHFLVEASLRGYDVPGDMLPAWKNHQKDLAARWWNPGDPALAQEQAYRLFILALANTADLSAMNRLRGESGHLGSASKWLLGAAYAMSGQKEAASSLTRGDPMEVRQYLDPGSSFGSDLRDQALAVYVLAKLGRTEEARRHALTLSDKLGKSVWYSTQSTAWTLLALSSAYGANQSPWSLTANWSGRTLALNGAKTLMTVPVEELRTGKPLAVKLTNKGANPLHVRWILSGVPPVGQEREQSDGIGLEVSYQGSDTTEVLDPTSLEQGQDFTCWITVTNKTSQPLHQLALSQVVASGWEIRSSRLAGLPQSNWITYQDVRDDRILTYFDLQPAAVRRFPVLLHAAYAGKYQLPGLAVEAMYDATIGARTKGRIATVEP